MAIGAKQRCCRLSAGITEGLGRFNFTLKWFYVGNLWVIGLWQQLTNTTTSLHICFPLTNSLPLFLLMSHTVLEWCFSLDLQPSWGRGTPRVLFCKATNTEGQQLTLLSANYNSLAWFNLWGNRKAQLHKTYEFPLLSNTPRIWCSGNFQKDKSVPG